MGPSSVVTMVTFQWVWAVSLAGRLTYDLVDLDSGFVPSAVVSFAQPAYISAYRWLPAIIFLGEKQDHFKCRIWHLNKHNDRVLASISYRTVDWFILVLLVYQLTDATRFQFSAFSGFSCIRQFYTLSVYHQSDLSSKLHRNFVAAYFVMKVSWKHRILRPEKPRNTFIWYIIVLCELRINCIWIMSGGCALSKLKSLIRLISHFFRTPTHLCVAKHL